MEAIPIRRIVTERLGHPWPPFRMSLVGRPGSEPLAQLIAIADTDKVARLRLLRALRDLEVDDATCSRACHQTATPQVLPAFRYRPIGVETLA